MRPNFTRVVTRDGSPTLALENAHGVVEHMHHSAGALAESVYIYQGALDHALPLVTDVRVLSIGLGLGYNEMLTIARLENLGRSGQIYSFEARRSLIDGFRAWAAGDTTGPLATTHAEIAGRIGLAAATVKRWLDDGRLELRGEFPRDAAGLTNCTLVYFDAFSRKMDPELWDEETLVEVFGRTLAPTCVLATYAATSALNRVLKRLKLNKQPKAGFFKKRQSTLAIRLAPDAGT